MIKFAFIIAIVTNDGTMDMRGEYLEQCPDKGEFYVTMEQLQAEGKFKDWDAVCVDLSKMGEDA